MFCNYGIAIDILFSSTYRSVLPALLEMLIMMREKEDSAKVRQINISLYLLQTSFLLLRIGIIAALHASVLTPNLLCAVKILFMLSFYS